MASQEEEHPQPFVDIFNEDETEKSFLLSKPACFIVLGKPGSGKKTLARKLAQIWKCIFIEELLFKGQSISEELVTEMILKKIESPEVAHYGYILSGFPSLSEEYMTVSQQIEKIKNLKLKPDLLINIKCSDNDLCQRISGQRQHPDSGQVYQRSQWDPNIIEKHKKEKDQHEEEDEEEDEEQEEEEVNIEQDELRCHYLVNYSVDVYVFVLKQDLMAEHDSQYLIELDGNQQPDDLFVVSYAYVASDKNYMCCYCCFNKQDELFRVLSSCALIARRYRWRRSRWGQACPVALKEGDIVMGNPDLAVSFLGKMYILSSPEALKAFMLNPRPYLLPPMPLPPCKVLVFGPPFSGRTTICNLIADKYKGKVLDMAKLIQPHMEELREENIEQVRRDTVEELMKNNKDRFPGAPEKGGWVVDNYPLSVDHWSALSEKGLLPDTVVCLKDTEKDEKNKEKKRHMGDTKHFCPVSLKENFVLHPGLNEHAAKYQEKIYYFSTSEYKDKFLKNPEEYVAHNEPIQAPPLRVCLLGTHGVGKTTCARQIADKLGIFHIQFEEYLQELILPKTKEKVGPDYDEEPEEDYNKILSQELEDFSQTMTKIETEKSKQEVKLTDEEEAIKANLMDNEALPPEVLDNIVLDWWRKEPFRSTGFILDGFPRTSHEAQYLSERGLCPDIAVYIEVEVSDILDRLFPPRLKKWKERQYKKKENKKKLKDLKTKIRVSFQSCLIFCNFSSSGLNTDSETSKAVKSTQRNRYGKLEKLLIPQIKTNGARRPHIVRHQIYSKLNSLMENRGSIFEKCYPISLPLAQKMLIFSYKFPSSFGQWDPVKLSEGEVIKPQQSHESIVSPVIYRQYIYFFSSKKNKETFMKNPIKYIRQPKPKPAVPVKIAIVGPPKSGKTTVAKKFASVYGLLRLSMGDAIRQVLNHQPETELALKLKSLLHKGLTVPDELAIQALDVALMNDTCNTTGVVIDGYPVTRKQVNLLESARIIPVKIFELEMDAKEVFRRALLDKESTNRPPYPEHDSSQILAIKNSFYKQHIDAIRTYYKKEHQNWCVIDAFRSKWWIWNKVLQEVQVVVKEIQVYLERIREGKAAGIADLCITPEELQDRLGEFGQYCPVTLAEKGELVDCSVTSSVQFAAEFRGHYYKMASQEELDKFLSRPEVYVPPLAPHPLPLPDMLPKKLTVAEVKALFPISAEMQGYCPVTYLDGKQRYEALVPGNIEYAAKYRDKLYIFESEEKLLKFMRSPEKYWNLKLPHKLPPIKEPILLTALPSAGYLEQGVATSLIKALHEVGCLKPKFPFLSVKKTALLFVACHLKGHNPRSPALVRQAYQRKLGHFVEQCHLLPYLGAAMAGPYRQPGLRPPGFDGRLRAFLSLKGASPGLA
uniref:Adenylate kinase 9 n=1 Tax=Calidris pygmaea TaxID=425635 RepID=A0A8C3KGY0_9CHAR